MKLLIIILILSSCAQGKKYAVRKVEHVKGRTYLVTTDSFSREVKVKGLGKYQPDSITIKRKR